MTYRTRFAPSPTGPLHLGHAYSALLAFQRAQEQEGAFLLRIDDIDADRCHPHWETQIYDDLNWLGLHWEQPVRRQSEHLPGYQHALDRLTDAGLVYPCSCSRGDIRAAQTAPQEGAPASPAYPGTCRTRAMASRLPGDALRLNMARAIDCLGDVSRLGFHDSGPDHAGYHPLNADHLTQQIGDTVLARRDMGAVSYSLAVVVDDEAQQITEIVRGSDLFEITALQVLLQFLLKLPTPRYHHHHLIRDDQGKRLAKRDDARAIARYRTDGASPADIRRMIGL